MEGTIQTRRLIHTTATGALLAFDVSAVCAAFAFAVAYTAFDPRLFVAHTIPLIWLPFAVAALCLIILELAAGATAALGAMRSQPGWWSMSFRVLLALAAVTPIVFALTKNVFALVLLALTYLVLPALALRFTGNRAGSRLLAVEACVAYAITAALLALSALYPRFGEDLSAYYDIYFPPQFTAAVIILLAGALCSVAAGIVCAVDGRLAGRRRWSSSFQIAVVAGLLGPFALAVQTHYPPLISLSPTLEVLLAILAAASYLALPVMTLIYLRKRGSPASRMGVPDVGTSL